jgi:ribokinase
MPVHEQREVVRAHSVIMTTPGAEHSAKNVTPRICVVGSCNLDLTFRVPRLPRFGETLAAHALHQGFGGKGANQAVAAARLGAQVAMIARVGDDAFGRQYLDNLRFHGIDTTSVQADPRWPTGMASIFVSDAGANCIVVAAGANAGLTPDDIRNAGAVIQRADVVLCQLETPVETALAAFQIARTAGVRTLLNPAPAADLPGELLRLTDLCVPNETELELLTARSLAASGGIEAAARILQLRGPASVVVTLGAAGALLLGATAELLAGQRVDAVDPTGAGDVFIGALAVFLAEGLALREAARNANAAAGLSVTRLGTQSAAPTRAEVEALLSRGLPQ